MLFPVVLASAALLYALVAGFLFGFAVVAMPGIGRLGDGPFIRAFQAMDRVIQDNSPLFLLVWVGSVLALIAAAVLGWGALGGTDRLLLVGAAAVYLLGVQAPTALVNIPLNNRIQAVDVAGSDAPSLRAAREAFERPWNRSNRVRTALAVGVAAALVALLVRL